MALTRLQTRVCRLLADRRIDAGERYVAGGLALNAALGAPRLSGDIDLFHDTEEAVAESSAADCLILDDAGLHLVPIRDVRGFVEVIANDDDGESVVLQWVRESAYRFFPLVADDQLGLTLHPFDLATNKTLALVGRVEVRDWIDIITCHERLTPLGCLAWAACGKDPGLNPAFILEEAARTARYSRAEVDSLAFDGPSPDAGELSRRWRRALEQARTLIAALPAEHVGCAVLESGEIFQGGLDDLTSARESGRLSFHGGSIRGALPTVHATT